MPVEIYNIYHSVVALIAIGYSPKDPIMIESTAAAGRQTRTMALVIHAPTLNSLH